MAAGGSNIAIFGAITANTLIAISKFIAASFTGSSAMMAEGIHSLVDTGNGLLLLLGIKRSKQKPDAMHPFGYGKEVYFWSFVVSVLIFALGGGFALYEGIHALMDPHPLEDPTWSYWVLTAAIVFEGSALYVALKAFNKSRKNKRNLIRNIIKSKDAATFAVIIEDTAALVGLAIALTGVFLSQELQNPYMDGGASVLIGLLLLSVATFLARESKGLLLGESATPETISGIEKILDNNEKVQEWNLPQTMHFGPSSVLLVQELDLIDGLSLEEAEKAMKEIKKEIKQKFPSITRVYLETKDLEK